MSHAKALHYFDEGGSPRAAITKTCLIVFHARGEIRDYPLKNLTKTQKIPLPGGQTAVSFLMNDRATSPGLTFRDPIVAEKLLKTLETLTGADEVEDFGRIIDRYTRAEAIADGVLIDVTTTANEAGLRLPTAITAALNTDIHAIPPFESHQDPEGRLWDVLRVGHARILAEPNTSGAIDYDLVMQCGRRSRYRVRMLLGTGDTGEAVLTVMKPDED